MNPALEVGWDVAGNIRMQGGEYEEALARYERCLHLDPQSLWRTYVWPSMAGGLVAMGRFDEAIVLALDPVSSTASRRVEDQPVRAEADWSHR